MNKYWPYYIALAAVVFVGFVIIGYNGNRPSSAIPQKTQVGPSVSPTPNITSEKGISTQTNALPLTISQPANGTQVTAARITVAGKTAPKAEVFVNDLELSADSKGNFSTSLNLDEGDNIITVSANDDQGNSSEQEITVTYNPK